MTVPPLAPLNTDSALDARLDRAAQAVKTAPTDDAGEAAKAFEAVFLTQIVELMMKGVNGEHAFGGGHAEGMWRSVLSEHIADAFAERGGLGIASHVRAEIIRLEGKGTE